MKRIAAFCLLVIVALPAAAVEDGQVMYVGGTAAELKEGAVGRLNTTSQSALSFESAGSTLVIPYAKIESYEYTRPVARHLGVLPAIGVGLVKKRQRRHFFRIAYRDESDASRVVIFEVPKQMPPVLLAILRAQAPQGCKAHAYAWCSGQN
ncbi:MAG TPA: hypothetical protein VN822_09920 [Candidatus Acidoferrales bacterium]|nr:hypothetical protein [Candidatus Acidoferrales bacterium]